MEMATENENPEWLTKLEDKQKRAQEQRLAHEIGFGSPCVKCNSACPGLDLHFWRKICRNCKCKREDHDIVEDSIYLHFDVLFGLNSSRSKSFQKNPTLSKLETNLNDDTTTTAGLNWLPPNVPDELAKDYIKALSQEKLPVTGSEGARYRRHLLEKQIPLHDFNPKFGHQGTSVESGRLKDYAEHLKENVVGQGQVTYTPSKLDPKFKSHLEDLLSPHDATNKLTSKEHNLKDLNKTKLCSPSNTLFNNSNQNNNDQSAISTENAIADKLNENKSNGNTLNNNIPGIDLKNSVMPELLPNNLIGELDNLSINDNISVCKNCQKTVEPGSVIVTLEKNKKIFIWHPACFVCTSCNELLADLYYFYHKENVYCGRDYAKVQKIPRCFACDELIFVNEWIVTEGQNYHVNHYCCIECDISLADKQYLTKDSHPLCLECFHEKYAKICRTCDKKIMASDKGVTLNNLNWHAVSDCFKCGFCQKSLLETKFVLKENTPFCNKDCVLALKST